ncbi:hypothetical protein SBA1_700019 [Candidatus Sulfotelmatobacter kueseliae]|uniref:Uncharacterized protein n=1 Tax=Candidatus Sulfotelmatobacter kueseliae TaxID=2042962 RepID=A0A2U3L533_9BACT|nr:hypothetical protein SBA1_700019 [Candidatus Sulfotelmatobacter kueseliae]
MKRDATRELPFVFGQQQAAFGRTVVARQASEFLLKILEAQTEAQRLRVFEEEFKGLGDLRSRFGLSNCETLNHREHRGHRGSWRIWLFGLHFL